MCGGQWLEWEQGRQGEVTIILKTKFQAYDLINKIEVYNIRHGVAFPRVKARGYSLQWVGLSLAFQLTPGWDGDL